MIIAVISVIMLDSCAGSGIGKQEHVLRYLLAIIIMLCVLGMSFTVSAYAHSVGSILEKTL